MQIAFYHTRKRAKAGAGSKYMEELTVVSLQQGMKEASGHSPRMEIKCTRECKVEMQGECTVANYHINRPG